MCLKWPNDLLIGADKFGGILVESTNAGRQSDLLPVIGIGINIGSHPVDRGQMRTHLARHGLSVTPDAVLARLAPSLAAWLATWDEGRGFAAVREAWLERSISPGEWLAVNTGAQRVEGTFLGIDANGSLLLQDQTSIVRQFSFGDVSLMGHQTAADAHE
jgi:BirA family biotin operon repressor/biotin-[acetyl-CoA-carboxylase] ligase